MTTPNTAAQPLDLDSSTLWEIHGVVKNAGSTRLAHKIADAIARRTPPAAPAPAAQVGAGELPPLDDGAIMKVADKMGIGLSSMLRAFATEIARAAIAQHSLTHTDPITFTVDGVTMPSLEYIDYLHGQLAADRAQLARQGQGEPVYQVQYYGETGTSVWRDATENAFHTFMPGRRRIVYLAAPTAPASVQPAELEFLDTLQGAAKEATDEWIAGFVRQHFGIYGAQPDQRESAAPAGWIAEGWVIERVGGTIEISHPAIGKATTHRQVSDPADVVLHHLAETLLAAAPSPDTATAGIVEREVAIKGDLYLIRFLPDDHSEVRLKQSGYSATTPVTGTVVQPVAKTGEQSAVTLVCHKCGADRLREPCGNTRDCGMIFEAQGQDSAKEK